MGQLRLILRARMTDTEPESVMNELNECLTARLLPVQVFDQTLILKLHALNASVNSCVPGISPRLQRFARDAT